MGWLQIVQFALMLAPEAIKIIVAIEAAISGAGLGPTKKKIAMESISASANVAGASSGQFEVITKAASTLIDNTVTALNLAGVFKKGA